MIKSQHWLSMQINLQSATWPHHHQSMLHVLLNMQQVFIGLGLLLGSKSTAPVEETTLEGQSMGLTQITQTNNAKGQLLLLGILKCLAHAKALSQGAAIGASSLGFRCLGPPCLAAAGCRRCWLNLHTR